MATTAGSIKSQYVKAAAATLPLMPGADLSSSAAQEAEQEAGPSSPAQLTIVYGGRMLVLDDVPADKAAELLRLAAASAERKVLPAARKASLQRFMEKRKGRVAARAAPYLRPDDGAGSRVCPDRLALAL